MVVTERTDERIKRDIVAQLYWDSRVDALDVKVQVDDGVVTLSGSLSSYFTRASASEDTWAVPGVLTVKNRTVVRYNPSVDTPSDSEIQVETMKTLGLDPDLNFLDLAVEVNEGEVTLGGTVDAFWKKDRAVWLAGNLRGVVDVIDKLAVVPTGSVVDKDIARDVVAALEREVLVDADDIGVRVNAGQVSLTGSVPNWAAHNAVYRAAAHTLGVTQVTDNLIVAAT